MRFSSNVSGCVAVAATISLASCSGGGSGISAPAVGGTAQQNFIQSVGPLGHLLSSFAAGARTNLGYHGPPIKPFFNAALAKKANAMIAVSDEANSVVDIFNPAGTLIGQLTGFAAPLGLASDIKGDLYVADQVNSRVVVYGAGLQGEPTYIADPNQIPFGIDSFRNGAYLAVANLLTTNGGAGSISIFKGSTLIRSISDPNVSLAFYCAFDATGNLFVTVADATGQPAIGEIANATSGGTAYTTLTTSNQFVSDYGSVQVTTAGQIAVGDAGPGSGPSTIYTYNAPSGGALGTPVQTTILGGSKFETAFAFTKTMTDLYAADRVLATANEFAYPAGGTAVSTLTPPGLLDGAAPYGIAVIPTQFPSSK